MPPAAASLRATSFGALPGWQADDLSPAWEAFQRSCGALRKQPLWQEVCTESAAPKPSAEEMRRFFESRFLPYQVVGPEGGEEGLITGYYEPLLRGSRSRSPRYAHPVYGVPADLLVVDLGEAYPELKNLRLRGRLDGRRVVPYWSRADIENGRAPLQGREMLWVDDPLDLFFLQVQGSGRVRLENGETLRLGYADQNGHPYKSIGRVLVERGELTVEDASMQGIRAWAENHPGKVPELLNQNASYVFFRELPADAPGPIGSLGVPLTAGRSLAVDPRSIPQGAPVYLATTWPGAGQPLQRLMVAQDTGGAIKGGVRADFFWGFGAEAGEKAGRMREPGRLWVLLPKGQPPEAFRNSKQ
ncbi:MAG TPA: MltA domain-containing protein [Burkholderiales bacterium]|nr:MltA domain-containing protein [Burkholderiales bacterium]